MQAVTEATVRTLECPPESVDILLHEIRREHWATGGKLWSDE